MDGPISNEGYVAIVHDPHGTNNSHPATEIHSISNIAIASHTGTTDGGQRVSDGIPHISDSPRTPLMIDMSSPDLFAERGSHVHHHLPNEHLQPQPQAENIHTSHDHPEPNTINDGNTRRKRKLSGLDIHDNEPSCSAHSPSRDKAKQRRTSHGKPTTDQHLGSRHNRTSAPSPSSRFANAVGEDDTDGSCDNGISYTFILHKSGCDVLPPTNLRNLVKKELYALFTSVFKHNIFPYFIF
jgi:hypothetical protein